MYCIVDKASMYLKNNNDDNNKIKQHTELDRVQDVCKHPSAAEVGTTRASINRTGKTNTAKGVENHYNEYSEFHAREIEAHICASFIGMTGMKAIDGSNNNE